MNAVGSFAALLVVALGYGTIVPLAPTLLRGQMASMGAEALSLHTGALSAAYLFAFAALAPFWGRAVDAGSRRRVAMLGLSGFATSFLAMALVTRIWVLYAGLAVAGASAAAIVPSVQVQIATLRDEGARARFLAVLGAASFTGSFLGPPLASWSLARGSFAGLSDLTFTMALVAALGIVAAGLSIARPPERSNAAVASEAAPRASAGRDWVFAMLAMSVSFAIGGYEVSLVLWVGQVLGLGSAVVARMLIECTIVMALVQALIFLVPAARPRWRPRAAAAAFAVMAAAIAATPWAAGAGAFAAVAALAASATLLQTMISLGTVAAAGSRSGSALGLQLSLSSAGQGLGSLGAGALFSANGTGFLLPATLLAASAVYAYSLRD